MKSLLKLTTAFSLLAIAVVAQTSAPAAWTPELQIKTRTVGTPRVSPEDARRAHAYDRLAAPTARAQRTQDATRGRAGEH